MGKIRKGFEIDSASKSDLVTFEMCGEKYRRQKLNGEWMPLGYAGVRGISVHSAVEVNSKNKIEKGDDLPIQTLYDAFDTKWAEEAKKRAEGIKATGYDPDKVAEGEEPVKEEDLKTAGRAFVQVYRDQAAPHLMPTASETNFEVPLMVDGKKVKLRGIIDWMGQEIVDWEARKMGQGVSILDFKTTDKTPKNEAWRSFELVVYAMAMKEIAGEYPDQVGLLNLVNMKTKSFVHLDTFKPTDDHVKRLLARLSAFFKAVHAEAFHPASLMFGAWWCNPQFCGFWETCGLRPK